MSFHRAIDETGNRYGKWTVLSRAGTRGRQAMWLCRCDCGTEKRVEGHLLRIGHTKQCMACRKFSVHVNLTGMKLGGWTVIRYLGFRRTGSASTVCEWLCRCECGKEKAIPSSHLLFRQNTRCRECASKARRVPDAERVCRWCPRKPTRLARECDACNRTACRNGRDAEGRPIAKGARQVDPSAPCRVCGGPVGHARARFCSEKCYGERERERLSRLPRRTQAVAP